MSITRPGALTKEEAEEIEHSGGLVDRIRRSPKYVQMTELGIKILIGLVWGLVAWVFSDMKDAITGQMEILAALQKQDQTKTYQIEDIKKNMQALAERQDSVVGEAKAAVAQFAVIEREVRMLEYYVLEMDAKLIARGLKNADDAVANKLLSERQKQQRSERK